MILIVAVVFLLYWLIRSFQDKIYGYVARSAVTKMNNNEEMNKEFKRMVGPQLEPDTIDGFLKEHMDRWHDKRVAKLVYEELQS